MSLILSRSWDAALLLAVVAAPMCTIEPHAAPCPDDPLMEEVRAAGELRVIVRLVIDPELEGEERRQRISELQKTLLAELDGTRLDIVTLFERFPLMTLQVGEEALCRLLRSPRVERIQIDRAFPPAE